MPDASRAYLCESSVRGRCRWYAARVKEDYRILLDGHLLRLREREIVPLQKARDNGFKIDWSTYLPPVPEFTGVGIMEVKVRELVPYIDWTPFFRLWNLNGRYPAILKDEVLGKEATSLFKDAGETLKKMENLTLKGVYGIFEARSEGDDIIVVPPGGREAKFLTLRQQSQKSDGVPNLALSDFIAPAGSGITDYIGAFCVTAGPEIEKFADEKVNEGNDYASIMFKAAGDRLAEAFAEYLHERVRKEIWGYAKEENFTPQELIAVRYRGIRPAPGYPACPDHLEKSTIWNLLGTEERIGAKLTPNMAMWPASTISGYYFSHPESKYFGLGRIGRDQLEDYARRRGISVEEAEKWLLPHIM